MAIDKGPNGPEKTIEEKISEFKFNFDNWLAENPVIAKQLKDELLELAGIEESELTDPDLGFDLSLIKVPIAELSAFGTICGETDNKSFSKKVINFLESKGVEFIIGLGENKKPVITSAAINISAKDAERFSKIIDSSKGSLDPQDSQVDGWSIFESE
ncbi:MAG: hypothetical protein WCW02_03220 [Candidatus Buchananbacteria bacterium]